MTNDPDILGHMVSDKITGFRGRATVVATHISGCVQVCIAPGVKDDGTEREGRFFDIQRVVIDHSVPRVLLDNTKSTGPADQRGILERERPL